jgi:hypothetical protein
MFRPHYGPGVDSVSSNEYQRYFPGSKGGQCVGLANLPPSCADYLEIGELQTPGAFMACNRPVQDFFFTANKLSDPLRRHFACCDSSSHLSRRSCLCIAVTALARRN